MNSKEVIMELINGHQPDRLPVFPVVDDYFAPTATGRDLVQCRGDARLMAAALMDAFRQYSYDGIVCPLAPVNGVQSISGRDDLEKACISDLEANHYMSGVCDIVSQVGKQCFVTAPLRAPFEMASAVRGLSELYVDIRSNPGFVMSLIEHCLEIALQVGDALIRAGVDCLTLKDSVASPGLISPVDYRRFVWPFERVAIQQFQERVPVILHICRDSEPILDDMVKTGARVLEIDSPVQLACARDIVGGRAIIKGNLDAVNVLEKGSEEAIRRSVNKAARVMRGHPFILSTGDSVPPTTPDENIRCLVCSAREAAIAPRL